MACAIPRWLEIPQHFGRSGLKIWSGEILRTILPSGISPTSIHRLVRRVAEPHLEQEEAEIEDTSEHGVLREPEGRVVPYLFGEADDTNITLSREKAKRAEVRIGIACEGWEEAQEDRYRVKAKTVYRGILDGEKRLVAKYQSPR